jgi:uncharacterized integral membrane protein
MRRDKMVAAFYYSNNFQYRIRISGNDDIPCFEVARHAGPFEEDVMPLLHRSADRAADKEIAPGTAAPSLDSPPSTPAAPAHETPAVPITRTSVAWIGVWTVTILLVAFIVFILQNTRGVQVSFLWLHGTLPLAVGLLMAMVAGIVVTLMLGTARITQLRRLARRRRA